LEVKICGAGKISALVHRLYVPQGYHVSAGECGAEITIL